MNKPTPARPPVWLSAAAAALEDFRPLVERQADPAATPLAAGIVRNVVVYDANAIRAALGDERAVRAYMAEWHDVLLDGPGILVFRNTYPDGALVDAVTEVLTGIIARERAESGGRGDHFASGSNARVWNAHEKLCLADPALYARYNANPIVDLVSRAWLGPLYQITTQVNLVYPGGAAQKAHRDYHMGFQTAERLEAYPAVAHRLSPALTLQGAIAHCDMAVESGPTKLLPFSQGYLPGYLAFTRPDFRDYFEARHVQVPLAKGDSLFFNPAIMHAAGENRTADVQRFANLLQVSSAYGRAMELVDRARMTRAVYPELARMAAEGALTPAEVDCVVAATAEGYPFPADLDVDAPIGGMAPPSQQDVLRQALAEGWEAARLDAEIATWAARRAR